MRITWNKLFSCSASAAAALSISFSAVHMWNIKASALSTNLNAFSMLCSCKQHKLYQTRNAAAAYRLANWKIPSSFLLVYECFYMLLLMLDVA